MANEMGRDRDLVLAPGEFAYVLDTTKGQVNVYSGPFKTSMAGTDQPVLWDKTKKKFERVDLDKAVQRNAIAPEGFYLALYNPSASEKQLHPGSSKSELAVDLNVGHRVNIPGPANFPLWPGQMAEVIRGHHLRSNQYLLAQVYNDEQATANWKNAVIRTTGEGEAAVTPIPRVFSAGQLLVIKGTDVAFFIPPTGIKVVSEMNQYKQPVFIRDAVTLERLEYCILLDENGKKRFVRGPDVVFPEPTEKFVEKDGKRKFLAIELNETSGIYIKVIADYEDETGKHKAGDELFITGKEQAIYFQREEHSVIRYGEQTKHYAVAIPSGEGRYVLDRLSGEIALIRGPRMLLCDPRHQVIVRRVLAPSTAALWYPGNSRVLEINAALEAESSGTDSMPMAGAAVAYSVGAPVKSSSLMAMNFTEETARNTSRQIAGDTMQRGVKFTPPRTITLDTKYEGAVGLSVWTGYAILVVDKNGARRVVEGPTPLLLEYDETLAPLELSAGRPKGTKPPYRTVYLRVHNNRVSDQISVETADLVKVTLNISYRVNFEGDDKEKWFAVENYVKLLCDHMRSMIRNLAKRKGIEEFYAKAIDIIRDTVLGVAVDGKRPGRLFDENGMRVYDLEVLDVAIEDKNVANLLNQAQMTALKSAIQISQEEQQLATTLRSEDIKRQMAAAKAETAVQSAQSAIREVTADMNKSLAGVDSEKTITTARLAKEMDEQAARDTLNTAKLARDKAVEDQKLALMEAEIKLEISKLEAQTKELVARANAVNPQLAAALVTLSDQTVVEKIAVSLAPMAAQYGISASEVLAKQLKGTPLEGILTALSARTKATV